MRLALWVRAVGFSQLWDIHHREEGVSGNQIQVIFNSIALISRSKVLIHHFITSNFFYVTLVVVSACPVEHDQISDF